MTRRLLPGALLCFLIACAGDDPLPTPDDLVDDDESAAGAAGRGGGAPPAGPRQPSAGSGGASAAPGGASGSGTGGASGAGGARPDAAPADADDLPGDEDPAAPTDAGAAPTDAGAPPSDASPAAPAGPPCPGGKYLLCEDFESTDVGAVPGGWARAGAAASVRVSEDQAFRGKRALKISEATFWQKRITRRLSIPGVHWGRVYYRVNTPAPRTGGVVHSTFVSFTGTSPAGGAADWRVVDTVQNSQGRHQFLYNVQPSGRGEFGRGSSYNWAYDNKWHCAEWKVDHANQSYQFFIDGAEVRQITINNGAGNYRGVEIPSMFTSISLGWTNYQRVTGGFVGWFDELVIDAKRVGCLN